MLFDERAAVNAHNLQARECGLKYLCGTGIVRGLCVCGVEYSLVDDKEIGICGRQALAVLDIYGR